MRFKDFYYIRRSDRRVLLFLLVIFVIVFGVMIFTDNDENLFTEASKADSAKVNDSKGYPNYKDYHNYNGNDAPHGGGYYSVKGKTVRLFPFDPNTADSTDLLALGLQPWQVRNIYKYRAAGGVYRRKEDFGRVYGLTNKQYHELEPYIRISKEYQPYVVVNEPRPRHVNIPDSIALHTPAKLKAGQKIELNSADSTQLMKVPGIGRYYARQIENRRKWLGGFYTPDQLMEIEYLPKEAINYFYVAPGSIKKLNVNKASLQELKRHPYINYYQARDIVDYRRLRGPIKSLDDLRLLKDFTEKDMERLKHYVEY